MSSKMGKNYPGFFGLGNVLSTFVDTTTTHGVRRMTYKGHIARKIFWVTVFLTCLTGCIYHCSHLIRTYLNAPKVTITEEKDDDDVIFPALTICNLNVIKKDYAVEYFDKQPQRKKGGFIFKRNTSQATCIQSESDLIKQSGIDLSDIWLNLGITKNDLAKYGHKAEDLIVTCTFNSKNCSGNIFSTFTTKIVDVSSPIFGLCHTVTIKDKSGAPLLIRKPGVSQGLRLTLNIEKEDYWDLISPEYGVRLLVHPQNTYPTMQRGGLVAGTGASVHIGIKRVISSREPGYNKDCFRSFEESPILTELKSKGLDMDLSYFEYTTEHCNILCRNSILYDKCGCLDEQSKDSSKQGPRFCNPCDKNQSACRSEVLRNFSDGLDHCDQLCKPACQSIRYDIRNSYSNWPNLYHQKQAMKKASTQWTKLFNKSGVSDSTEGKIDFEELANSTFFTDNFLRVHLYVRELSFMSIAEQYAYMLPKLLADLGGCLGLYLGVSVISIIEVIELFGNMSIICFYKTKVHKRHRTPAFRKTRKKKHKKKFTDTISTVFGSNYGTTISSNQHKNSMNANDRKRDRDLYFDTDKWGRSAYDNDYFYNRAANRLDIPH